ncbi:MAG TPA: tetratricopeptide repeat protein [Vicinamibacterales bacterium]|nr:tetratricopeptide repeat protein [Vicinamibacterales bacterium]
MSRHMAALAALLVVLSGSGLLAIRPKTEETAAPKKSPDAAAADAMNSGLKRLAKADELETKNPKQARKDYEGALKDFQTAVKLAPGNYRAHNNLGYSYRKLGNYARALESYEQALKLAPTFSEAIEYRAEAYLGLNRLDEAKQAYMQLFVSDRMTSHVLMKAMKAWVAKRRTDPAGVDAATLNAFDAWVQERDTLASSVLNLGHNSPDWR